MSSTPTPAPVIVNVAQGSGIPVWIAVVTPLLAFLGAWVAALVSRRGAKEQAQRWEREESLRMLRWTVELALDAEDEAKARMGWRLVGALAEADMLKESEQIFLDVVTTADLEEPLSDLEDMLAAGTGTGTPPPSVPVRGREAIDPDREGRWRAANGEDETEGTMSQDDAAER